MTKKPKYTFNEYLLAAGLVVGVPLLAFSILAYFAAVAYRIVAGGGE